MWKLFFFAVLVSMTAGDTYSFEVIPVTGYTQLLTRHICYTGVESNLDADTPAECAALCTQNDQCYHFSHTYIPGDRGYCNLAGADCTDMGDASSSPYALYKKDTGSGDSGGCSGGGSGSGSDSGGSYTPSSCGTSGAHWALGSGRGRR
eukprot:TRINITY_DN8399_c0_g1_i1.p2 TRINITY_DN8399_c0_g1~~TRINITY_DN8399_c0_g1_i1.p2  ORF type:complete len:149 (+),score=14.31 TRINITY_DN8399_c0_g1_i1:70-516(+)